MNCLFALKTIISTLLIVNVKFVLSRDCPNLSTHMVLGSINASTKADRFCDQFNDVPETSVNYKGGGKRENMNDSKTSAECKTLLKPYFAKYKEDVDSIDQFVEECKEFYDESTKCAAMIVHLNNYCYSMNDAYELTKELAVQDFQAIGGYEKIGLYQQDWVKYKSIKYMDVHLCLREFFDRPTKETQSSNISDFSAVQIMEYYLKRSRPYNHVICSCEEVFGLYKIYLELLKKNLAVVETSLQNLYENICFVKNKRYSWSREQFDAIVNTADYYSTWISDDIIKFLNECDALAKYWCNPRIKNSYWPFSYLNIILKIRGSLKSTAVSEYLLFLVTYAIRADIAVDDFKKFIGLTKDDVFKELNTSDCLRKTLQDIYELDKYNGEEKSTERYIAKERIWSLSSQDEFRKKLQFFAKIFQSSLENKTITKPCDQFNLTLKTFEDVSYKTNWNGSNVNEILEKAVEKGRSYDVFNSCMKLCADVSDGVQKHFNQRLSEKQLEQFAQNLLSLPEKDICDQKNDKFNVSDKIHLEKLLTSVLKEDIGEIIKKK